MTFRRIQLTAVAIVLSTFFLSSPSTDRDVVAGNAAKASSATRAIQFTFEGCWTQFAQGPCRDVYRDQDGGYWICRDCGTTGNPTPGKCSPISSATLARGFWCS
jgi:hypothetical protein